MVVAGDRSTGEAAAERILARMRTSEKRDVSELLNEADALLYDAKAAGKDAVRFQSASGSVS
ncbi:hypothetical protein [Rhizobium sp.]|uniref:hypothetical protein n=1 Tax=Rhizobium sp. TaxID=391 RepID=UPI003917500C